MTRRSTHGVIVAVAAHCCIESGAGIGLPGEPLLGRTRAVRAWSALFAAHLVTARARGRSVDRLLALANGGYQARALQHYLTWPWRLRCGVPILTDAEGLPAHWLPAYNAALPGASPPRRSPPSPSAPPQALAGISSRWRRSPPSTPPHATT